VKCFWKVKKQTKGKESATGCVTRSLTQNHLSG